MKLKTLLAFAGVLLLPFVAWPASSIYGSGGLSGSTLITVGATVTNLANSPTTNSVGNSDLFPISSFNGSVYTLMNISIATLAANLKTNGLQLALGYSPMTNSPYAICTALQIPLPTNSVADALHRGVLQWIGYTPPTNSFSGLVSALGFNPATNSLAGVVAALGYTPSTNSLAGVVAALGYTPSTNSLAGVVAALGYTPSTNSLTGILAALGYTPSTNSLAGIKAALGYTPLTNSFLAVTNALGYRPATNGVISALGASHSVAIVGTDTGSSALSSILPSDISGASWGLTYGSSPYNVYGLCSSDGFCTTNYMGGGATWSREGNFSTTGTVLASNLLGSADGLTFSAPMINRARTNITLVCFGTSITQGYLSASNYPVQLTNLSFFKGRTVLTNAGVSGNMISCPWADPTIDMTMQYTNVVRSFVRSQATSNDVWMILEGGYNDQGYGAATVFGELTNLIRLIRSDGVQHLVLWTIWPDTRVNSLWEPTGAANGFNELIRQNPSLYDYLFDAGSLFANSFNANFFNPDGVHPNAAGDKLIARWINGLIEGDAAMCETDGKVFMAGNGSGTNTPPGFALSGWPAPAYGFFTGQPAYGFVGDPYTGLRLNALGDMRFGIHAQLYDKANSFSYPWMIDAMSITSSIIRTNNNATVVDFSGGTTVSIFGNLLLATNRFAPVVTASQGSDGFWNSNHVLFWVTSTSTNKIGGP